MEYKVIAIKYESAGNDTVGHMWRETKIFELTDPIKFIFQWANNDITIKPIKKHIEITITETE